MKTRMRKIKKRLLKKLPKFSKLKLLLIVLVFGGVGAAVIAISRAANRPLVSWPQIYYQAGTYGITRNDDDARLFLATELDFNNAGPRAENHYTRELGIKSFDGRLRLLIHQDKTDAAIIQDVRNYLNQDNVKNDAGLIGFILLDDYQKDVRRLLPRVRSLVQESNRISPVKRAVICPFSGGPLLPNGVRTPDQNTENYINRAISNYHPDGCDLVSFYIYSGGPNGRAYDWSMAHLMPYLKSKLRAKGWDERRQPLIGTPQTFHHADWALPTPAQMEMQTEGFCQHGAVAIWGYTWYNDVAAQTLSNSENLRAGLERGINRCKRIWPKPLTGNQLYNSGFEAEISGEVGFSSVRVLRKWVVNNNRKVVRVNHGQLHRGEYMLASRDNSGTEGLAATQVLEHIPGAKSYTLSAFYRWGSGPAAQNLYLDYLDSNFRRIDEPTIGRTTAGTAAWKFLSVSRRVPGGTKYVRVIIYSNINDVSAYNWDTTRLVPTF